MTRRTRSASSDLLRGEEGPITTPGQTKHRGTVVWFNVKAGYGFIKRQDTGADVFVHRLGIVAPNPRHVQRSLGEGESVMFTVSQTTKGPEAKDVTGPGGVAVQGSVHARRRVRAQGHQAQGPVSYGGGSLIVEMCIATAKAFAGDDKGAFRFFLKKMFEENGMPHLVIPECLARDSHSVPRRGKRRARPPQPPRPSQPATPRTTPRKRLRLDSPLNRRTVPPADDPTPDMTTVTTSADVHHPPTPSVGEPDSSDSASMAEDASISSSAEEEVDEPCPPQTVTPSYPTIANHGGRTGDPYHMHLVRLGAHDRSFRVGEVVYSNLYELLRAADQGVGIPEQISISGHLVRVSDLRAFYHRLSPVCQGPRPQTDQH